MHFIFKLFVISGVVLLASKLFSKVAVKSFGSAFVVALLFGILNSTLGFLLSGIFHVLTLGLLWLVGLGFIIRLLASAIILKVVDAFVPGFKITGFSTALLLALLIALTGTWIDWWF